MKKYPDFQEINLSDKYYFDNYFSTVNNEISEFAFSNLFCWRKYYKLKTSCHLEVPLISSEIDGENVFLFTPVEKHKTEEILQILINHSKQNTGSSLLPKQRRIEKIILISEQTVKTLKNYDFIEKKNDFDYIYKSSELAKLTGKIFDGKRNRCTICERYDPKVVFINKEIIKECIQLQNEWFQYKTENVYLAGENEAILDAFNNFNVLGLEGIAVKINNKVVAFAIGEKLNKSTYVIHFEKANIKFTGIYQFINNAFAKIINKNYEFINREQDMGIPGLKKAKMSYHPYKFIKKYDFNIIK